MLSYKIQKNTYFNYKQGGKYFNDRQSVKRKLKKSSTFTPACAGIVYLNLYIFYKYQAILFHPILTINSQNFHLIQIHYTTFQIICNLIFIPLKKRRIFIAAYKLSQISLEFILNDFKIFKLNIKYNISFDTVYNRIDILNSV